ncbi:hypothetical protein [Bradyrhizobium canariense]|uniref:hypothetical protein n=1 Tax=Bradyrhizobium canariense TaxID=255045 RepID=UPI00117747AD|nr:hypothetical protein [Bradyrhizobium canariense]
MDIDHDNFLVNEVGHSQADNIPNQRRLSDEAPKRARAVTRIGSANTVRNDFWYWPILLKKSAVAAQIDQ